MNLRYFAELVVLAALWGASFLFLRLSVPEFGPIWLIEWRVLLAGLALLPLLIQQQQVQELRRYAVPLFLVGGMNSALPFVLFAYAAITLSAGLTSILNATAPLFGILLVMLNGKESLNRAQIGGFVLGFVGVAILLGWRSVPVTGHFWLAIAAGLFAALLYAISANYIKYKLTGVPAPVIATGSQLGAALWLLPLLPFSVPAAMPSQKAIFALIGLALFSTALAYLMYFRLIRLLGTARALTVTYMIPLFAMLWGVLFLKEPVTPEMILGCVIILTGTALANGVLKGLR